MGISNWVNQADVLELTHKGAPVLSHPTVISQQESQWEEEKKEDERGQQAHQAINELFSSLDEDE